jgi:sortase A
MYLNNHKNNKITTNIYKKLMAFIVMPLAFAFIGFLTLFCASSIPFGNISSYINILILDKPPTFSQGVSNIFKPSVVTENSTYVDINTITFPTNDTIYGQLDIENISISCPLLFGDDDKALNKGAGQYAGSFFPGYGGPILIAGHNNTCFKNLKNAKIGDTVKITTSYGIYKYRIARTDVRMDADTSAYTLKKSDGEILQLYTCLRVNTPVGNIKERFYAYGDLISGPKIKQ